MEIRNLIKTLFIGTFFATCLLLVIYTTPSPEKLRDPKYKSGYLNSSPKRFDRSTENFENVSLLDKAATFTTENAVVDFTMKKYTTLSTVKTTRKELQIKTSIQTTAEYITTPTLPENIQIKKISELGETIKKGALKRTFNQSPPVEVGYIVPYKLHFIWITHPLPTKYIENLKTYRKFNQIYQMHLWVDNTAMESAKQVQDHISNLVLHNIDELDMVDYYLFHKAGNVGIKADILRYEIVWREGGIYCDIDSVALKPFDSNFLHSFVMFTLHPYYNLSNAAFGFPKMSNFLKFVLSILEENFAFESYPPSLSGPGFLTTCFLAFNDENINMIDADYLVFHTEKSFTYHTNDANWINEMK